MIKLYACNTGKLASSGGLAYGLSKLYPNMKIMAPTTQLSIGANTMRHVNAQDGNPGHFNVY